MTPIYMHEYTFTAWNKGKMGLQQVVVTVVTETKEGESFAAEGYIRDLLESDMNVSHKILLEGYRND